MLEEREVVEDRLTILTAADLGGQGIPLWNYPEQVAAV